jgi:hypothetical protein
MNNKVKHSCLAAALALTMILGGCADAANETAVTDETTPTTTTAAVTTTTLTAATDTAETAEDTSAPNNGGAVGLITAPSMIAYADLFYDEEYTVVTVDGTDLGDEMPQALRMRLRLSESEITRHLADLKYQVPTVYDDLLAALFSDEGDLKIAEVALDGQTGQPGDFGAQTVNFLEDVSAAYPEVSVTTQPGDFILAKEGLTGFDPSATGMIGAYYIFVKALSSGDVYAELPYPALYTNAEDTSESRFNVSALFAACRPWNYAFVTNPTAWLASQFGDYLGEGYLQILSVDSANEHIAMFAGLNPESGKYNLFIVNNSGEEQFYTFNIEKTETGGEAVYRRVTAFDETADPQWSVEEDAFYPVDHDYDEQVAPGTYAYSVTLPAYSVTTLSGDEQPFTLSDPYGESISTYNDLLTLPYIDSFDEYYEDYLDMSGGGAQYMLGGMKVITDDDGNGVLRSQDEINGFGDAANIGDSKWTNISFDVDFRFNQAEYLSIGTADAPVDDLQLELRADGSWYVYYRDTLNPNNGGTNGTIPPLDPAAWHTLSMAQTEQGVEISIDGELLVLCENAYLQGAVHLFGKVTAEFDNLLVSEGYPLYEAE